MALRLALIDSAGDGPQVVAARCFRAAAGAGAERCVPDPTGHGSRLLALLAAGQPALEFVLAQVFAGEGAASAAAVAAALDWSRGEGATLVQLSLGLAADRPVLAAAVARAVAAGCLVVAAAPARGGPVWPAAYPGVIAGTGDARCGPGELSRLGAARFGGCPRYPADAPAGQGASVGAAWVMRALVARGAPQPLAAALAALAAESRYDGPERRLRPDPDPDPDPRSSP